MKHPFASQNLLSPLVASFGLLLLASPLMAAEEPQTLRPTDIGDSNVLDFSRFGAHVDTQGKLLVVAAPNVHAAYIYALQDGTWQHVAKLADASASPTDAFATDVALDGDTIIVSAPGETVDGIPGAGAIHVYERGETVSDWTRTGRIVASNPTTDANLGDDLVVDGRHIAATAPGADATAYLFERDAESGAWNEVLRSAGIAQANPQQAEVDVSGSTFVHRLVSNEVLIYERGDAGWTTRQRITTDDLAVESLALADDVLVLGMPDGSVDERGRGEGVARIYERDAASWTHTATVHAANPYPTYAFGYGADLQDGLLAVSQRPENGAIFIFGRDESGEWTFLAELAGIANRFEMPDMSVSAQALALGTPTTARVHAYDIAVLAPEPPDDDDDGTGDDESDGNGNGDDGSDEEGSDDGNDIDDDGSSGAADDSGSDDSADDSSGDDTSSENDDSTSNEPAPGDSDGGGGSLGWMIGVLAVLVPRKRTLEKEIAAKN